MKRRLNNVVDLAVLSFFSGFFFGSFFVLNAKLFAMASAMFTVQRREHTLFPALLVPLSHQGCP